ncbi:MAG TPA: tetratricopeptide repeat protein [Candidatus Omnitrophota bacterium]|nr:tetratricopeptide repeat protein [Candidatus Omnitrophota bacterium]
MRIFLAVTLISPLFFNAIPVSAAEENPDPARTVQVSTLMDQAARYRSENRIKEAIQAYQEAAGLDPKNPMIYRNLGVLFYEAENEEDAERYLKESLGLKNDDPYTYLYLGKIFLKKENPDQALFYYQKALEINPGLQEAHFNLGILFEKKGDIQYAQKAFETAKSLEPQDPRPYVGMGSLCLKSRMYPQAIQEFERALQLEPDLADAYNGTGVAYYEMRKFREAEDAFLQALSIDPKYATAMNNLGVLYMQAGRYYEARRAFSRALRVEPGNEQAQENLTILADLESRGQRSLFDSSSQDSVFSEQNPFSSSRNSGAGLGAAFPVAGGGMNPFSSDSAGGSSFQSSGQQMLFQIGGILLSQFLGKKFNQGSDSQNNSHSSDDYQDSLFENLFGKQKNF